MSYARLGDNSRAKSIAIMALTDAMRNLTFYTACFNIMVQIDHKVRTNLLPFVTSMYQSIRLHIHLYSSEERIL